MSNPAELLHATLTTWRGTSNWASSFEQRVAVRHLDQIEELLDRMEAAGHKTSMYRQHYDKWVLLTLHNPHEWQAQNSASRAQDDLTLSSLEYLADKLAGILDEMQPGGLDQVREYGDSVRKLLDEDDSIDDVLLIQHVKQVLAHLDWCIANYDAVGTFTLQEAIERLVASMIRATAKSSRKAKWVEKLNSVAWPFVAQALATIAATPAQLAIQQAFGS